MSTIMMTANRSGSCSRNRTILGEDEEAAEKTHVATIEGRLAQLAPKAKIKGHQIIRTMNRIISHQETDNQQIIMTLSLTLMACHNGQIPEILTTR